MATRRKRAVSAKVKQAQKTPGIQLFAASRREVDASLDAIETEWLRLCESPETARKSA